MTHLTLEEAEKIAYSTSDNIEHATIDDAVAAIDFEIARLELEQEVLKADLADLKSKIEARELSKIDVRLERDLAKIDDRLERDLAEVLEGQEARLIADGPLSGISSEDDYTPEMIDELHDRAVRNIARDNAARDLTEPSITDISAVDYCPHCATSHVIGEHPRDGESEREYWSRMRRR